MLKEWKVRNFKSFGDTPSVFNLSHLNMVCGANSSGKSSLIQTILTVAQTLSSENKRLSLVLNGRYTRLGFGSDVIHGRSENAQLEIGYRLLESTDKTNSLIFEKHLDGFSCNIRFRLVRVNNREASDFELEDVVLRAGEVGTVIRPDGTPNRPSNLSTSDAQPVTSDAIRRSMQAGLFDYFVEDATPDSHPQRLKSNDFPAQVEMHNFLPVRFVSEFDFNVSDLIDGLVALWQVITTDRSITGVLRGGQHVRLGDKFIEPNPKSIADVLLEAIDRLAMQEEPDERVVYIRNLLLQDTMSLGAWLDVARRSHDDVRRFLRSALPRDREAFFSVFGDVDRIRVRRLQEPYSQVSLGVDQSRILFAERLRYLGPLRDDPRMIYALPNNLDSMDVGSKGEFTAYVIDRFGEKTVECPVPFGQVNFGSTQWMSLKNALILWLDTMGLTTAVDTRDRGRIGTELTIAARGVRDGVDLTNVGVGVSQVLPMLTLCLLAPRDSLILLEQPELHLHPKVQSILSDFLLGVARSGRQCIIETHSERMINRVRLHIAESTGTELMDAIRIFFVEKPEEETIVRSVAPNEYGAIPEWPLGFFDEGPDEAQKIIKAAGLKRRQNARKGSASV